MKILATEVKVGDRLLVNRKELLVSWKKLERRPWSPSPGKTEMGWWIWINGSSRERLLCIPTTELFLACRSLWPSR